MSTPSVVRVIRPSHTSASSLSKPIAEGTKSHPATNKTTITVHNTKRACFIVYPLSKVREINQNSHPTLVVYIHYKYINVKSIWLALNLLKSADETEPSPRLRPARGLGR